MACIHRPPVLSLEALYTHAKHLKPSKLPTLHENPKISLSSHLEHPPDIQIKSPFYSRACLSSTACKCQFHNYHRNRSLYNKYSLRACAPNPKLSQQLTVPDKGEGDKEGSKRESKREEVGGWN